jgi:hypothetical protein
MRWWDQRRQPVDERQGGEHQLGAAIRLCFGQVVHQPARTGAVTLIQRFGSALNLKMQT